MLRTFFYDHPHYHLKLFPTTTTFGEIFLNHVVAYFFTYTQDWNIFLPILKIGTFLRNCADTNCADTNCADTMVSAQFLRNVPILRYI